ncbi:MFS transporter [Ilumatobacter nonamiensis]|uniref:MFS transporter n=1 Tax=Ilumatobacter nonamiensis TaxID=467093 RepID=UPI00034963F7|nr:MFS transporter [Ilumatobacter nonamiensis]
METVESTPVGRWQSARTVARNPLLARSLRGLFAFSITEQGCWLAVLLFAFERGGVGEAGWLALFLLIPSAALAPVLAMGSDVFPRHRVLTIGYGLLAAASIGTGTAMVLDAPIVLIYALALVFAVILTFAGPATAAIIPMAATTPDELTAANTTAGMVENIGRLLGPLLAGVILVSSSPGAVLIWIGAVMAVGAIATVGRRTSTAVNGRHADDPERRSALVELTAGIRVLRNDRQIRTLVGAIVTTSWIAGALDVGAAVIAVDVLDRDEAAVSVLIVGFGAGGLLGSAASFALVGRRRLAVALAASVVLMSSAFGVVGWSTNVISATVLMVLVGTGVTLTSVTGRTMLQGLAPDDTLARLFGVLEALKMVGLALGGVALSIVAVQTSPAVAFATVGGVGVVGLIAMWSRLVSIDEARRPIDLDLLELARSTAIFDALPPYAVEQVMHALGDQSFEPGTVLMREGETGDRLCLIAEGGVEVVVGGEIVNHHGRGAVIGEIALLHDVPRSATVVSGPSGTVVYWIGAAAFLDAVNRVPRSRARAEAEANRRLGR